MKTSLSLLATAALAAVASAAGKHRPHFTPSNGTHFVDPGTNQTFKHFACGAHHRHASSHFNGTIKKLYEQSKQGEYGTRKARRAVKKANIQVPTHFHIINSAAYASLVTQDMINKQLAAMNTAYNPYGISFNLISTSCTTNDAWAVGNGSDMDSAKAALRVGSYSHLNIYFHTDLAGGSLGTCTLPNQLLQGVRQVVSQSDGCNVNANTMPGGSALGYNRGKTAVHETGHWLGLLHTFEGNSCSGLGDYVGDTPMEAQSTDGCPTSPKKNTCSSKDGDPIHNYMDYSTDSCYSAFTNGQVQRIQNLWNQYRSGK